MCPRLTSALSPSPRVSAPPRLLKRAFDFMVSSLALFLLAPAFLLLSLLILFDSPGPVFFRQRRAGLHGRAFFMYKFRTMRQDAEALLSSHPSAMRWDGPVFNVDNDARITRVGRYLRDTCLDELPQLFNVFRGDMSLVGPRPHLLEEAGRYSPSQRQRLACKPGLTGLWQVHSRHAFVSTEEGMRLDLDYVRRCSLALDLRILARTAQAVLFGRPARQFAPPAAAAPASPPSDPFPG